MDKKKTFGVETVTKVLTERLHFRLIRHGNRAKAEEKGHDGDHGKSVGVSCICVSVSLGHF